MGDVEKRKAGAKRIIFRQDSFPWLTKVIDTTVLNIKAEACVVGNMAVDMVSLCELMGMSCLELLSSCSYRILSSIFLPKPIIGM